MAKEKNKIKIELTDGNKREFDFENLEDLKKQEAIVGKDFNDSKKEFIYIEIQNNGFYIKKTNIKKIIVTREGQKEEVKWE